MENKNLCRNEDAAFNLLCYHYPKSLLYITTGKWDRVDILKFDNLSNKKRFLALDDDTKYSIINFSRSSKYINDMINDLGITRIDLKSRFQERHSIYGSCWLLNETKVDIADEIFCYDPFAKRGYLFDTIRIKRFGLYQTGKVYDPGKDKILWESQYSTCSVTPERIIYE